MDVRYERCVGTELFTTDSRRILDFLSGYCVHNLRLNHPAIIHAIKDELDRRGPAMLQSHVPELAGELGERLAGLRVGASGKHFSAALAVRVLRQPSSSPKRNGLLYAEGAFHGLTCGALSLMGDGFWKQGFGELLPGTQQIPFNHLDVLERELKTKKYAALFLEPIQGEAGSRMPDCEYLSEPHKLCHRYGTLFVLDEVQTGFYRTGKFLAAQHSE